MRLNSAEFLSVRKEMKIVGMMALLPSRARETEGDYFIRLVFNFANIQYNAFQSSCVRKAFFYFEKNRAE